MWQLISLGKWLLVVITVLLLAQLIIFGFFLLTLSNDKNVGDVKTSYPLVSAVEEALEPYVNITTTGIAGSTYTTYLNGTVFWIGSPEDSVKSIENVHLLMYTRLDSTETSGDLTIKHIGIHIEAYTSGSQLPTDAIDHVEVVIPLLGFDNPRYEFSLSCSTKI